MQAEKRATSREFNEQFERLVANWSMDEDRARTLVRDYRTIWDDVGQQRFTAAVDEIIHGSAYHFFPSCGEFRSFVPKPERAFWRDENCPECQGTGWKRVDGGVVRCPNRECLRTA